MLLQVFHYHLAKPLMPALLMFLLCEKLVCQCFATGKLNFSSSICTTLCLLFNVQPLMKFKWNLPSLRPGPENRSTFEKFVKSLFPESGSFLKYTYVLEFFTTSNSSDLKVNFSAFVGIQYLFKYTHCSNDLCLKITIIFDNS